MPPKDVLNLIRSRLADRSTLLKDFRKLSKHVFGHV